MKLHPGQVCMPYFMMPMLFSRGKKGNNNPFRFITLLKMNQREKIFARINPKTTPPMKE